MMVKCELVDNIVRWIYSWLNKHILNVLIHELMLTWRVVPRAMLSDFARNPLWAGIFQQQLGRRQSQVCLSDLWVDNSWNFGFHNLVKLQKTFRKWCRVFSFLFLPSKDATMLTIIYSFHPYFMEKRYFNIKKGRKNVILQKNKALPPKGQLASL